MLGINRDDANEGGQSFRNGQPVDLATINFGNPVTLPLVDGNPIPSDGQNSAPVDWQTPNPAHFGNDVT